MKSYRIASLAAAAALGLGLVAGCGERTEESPAAPPAGAATNMPGSPAPTNATGAGTAIGSAATVTDGKKDLKEAVCVVCAVNDGARQPEAVAASIEYNGKGYYFCKESEKAEFINNTGKYAVAGK